VKKAYNYGEFATIGSQANLNGYKIGVTRTIRDFRIAQIPGQPLQYLQPFKSRRGRILECGGSTPLFSRPPRRPSLREPRLAEQSGADAPHST
jgi:hypothetical protein